MRAFAIFVGLIALGLAGIAILGYPAWLLISPWLGQSQIPPDLEPRRHGVAGSRLHLRRAPPEDCRPAKPGVRPPLGKFVTEVGKAVFFGALLMMPAVLTMIAFDMLAAGGEAAGCRTLGPPGTGRRPHRPHRGAHRRDLPARRHVDGDHARIRHARSPSCSPRWCTRPRISSGAIASAGRRERRQRHRHADAHARGLRASARHRRCVPVPVRRRRVARHGARAHRQHRGVHGPARRLGVGNHVVRETSRAGARTRAGALLLSQFDGLVGWLVLAWTLVIGVG